MPPTASFEELPTLLERPYIAGCAVVTRTSTLRDLGGYDSRFPHTADTYLWRQIAIFANCGYVSESLYQYRVHADAMSAKADRALTLEQEHLSNWISSSKIRSSLRNAVFAHLTTTLNCTGASPIRTQRADGDSRTTAPGASHSVRADDMGASSTVSTTSSAPTSIEFSHGTHDRRRCGMTRIRMNPEQLEESRHPDPTA